MKVIGEKSKVARDVDPIIIATQLEWPQQTRRVETIDTKLGLDHYKFFQRILHKLEHPFRAT